MFQSNTKPEYRVLVCGGKDYGKIWDERRSEFLVDSHAVHLLHDTLQTIKASNVPANHVLVIVHGAERGADTMASKWAQTHHIKEITFPADRSHQTDRNTQMLEESAPDLVVAFPGGTRTAHIVELASKTCTPLMIVKEDESS